MTVTLLPARASADPAVAITSERVTFTSGEAELVGYVTRPAGPAGIEPGPTIVMAHGLGFTRASGLQPFADRFAAAGARVVSFDYRYIGESSGTPRGLIEPARQLEDWRAAIDWARSQPWSDPARTALWGTSLSGGYVLDLGAEDPSLAAVISQTPHVNGPATALASDPLSKPELPLRVAADAVAGATGSHRVTIPLVGPPGSLALMNQPGALDGYLRLTSADPLWVNEVPASISVLMAGYSPDARAAVSTVPTYIGVGTEGAVTPPAPAIALADRMGATLRTYSGGHFDLYAGAGFDSAISDQIDFLAKALGL